MIRIEKVGSTEAVEISEELLSDGECAFCYAAQGLPAGAILWARNAATREIRRVESAGMGILMCVGSSEEEMHNELAEKTITPPSGSAKLPKERARRQTKTPASK